MSQGFESVQRKWNYSKRSKARRSKAEVKGFNYLEIKEEEVKAELKGFNYLEIKEEYDELKKRLEKLRCEQHDYLFFHGKDEYGREENLEEIKKKINEIINKLDFLFLDGDEEKTSESMEDKSELKALEDKGKVNELRALEDKTKVDEEQLLRWKKWQEADEKFASNQRKIWKGCLYR